MVYVFMAHGFEEIEALAAVDILRRADIETVMVGVGSKTITGSHGITVHCDISEREVSKRGANMIVLPGGLPGTYNLEKSSVVQSCIDKAVEDSKWIGAICAAPSILGRKNLLDGKRVTSAPGFSDQLGDSVYTASPVEVDGKIITANGAGSSVAFALKLVECLVSLEKATQLAIAMQCVDILS